MADAIKVMVVDDTDHVRQMLCDMLALDGYEIVGEAAHGEAAVAAVEWADPDVVVLDYSMPGIDGLETARRLRSLRSKQFIVLYSAYIDDDVRAQAAEIGISVCLGKVDGLDALEREISRLCRAMF